MFFLELKCDNVLLAETEAKFINLILFSLGISELKQNETEFYKNKLSPGQEKIIYCTFINIGLLVNCIL